MTMRSMCMFRSLILTPILTLALTACPDVIGRTGSESSGESESTEDQARPPEDPVSCTVVNTNTGFDVSSSSVDPWVISGYASQEDWADKDPPDIAGSGDDDYGIALLGWHDDGSGAVYQDVIGSSIQVGKAYTFMADVHAEPDFNPTSWDIAIEWWDIDNAFISQESLSLIGLVTPGSDATQDVEWQKVFVSGSAPVGTARATLVIHFNGTTATGGLQVARIDNALFLDGPPDCRYLGN